MARMKKGSSEGPKKTKKPASKTGARRTTRKRKDKPAADTSSSPGKTTLPAFGLAEEILGGASEAGGEWKGDPSASQSVPAAGVPPAPHDRAAPVDGEGSALGAAKPEVDLGPELHLVTFKVDREEYCVDISEVREIIRVGQITAVPNAPQFVKGVINIRGRVVPVLSLSRRLDVQEGALTRNSRIVVVDNHARPLGLLVDSVSHVLRVPSSSVEPPPSEAEQAKAYVKGIGKVNSRLVMIMDLERVLAREQNQPAV